MILAVVSTNVRFRPSCYDKYKHEKTKTRDTFCMHTERNVHESVGPNENGTLCDPSLTLTLSLSCVLCESRVIGGTRRQTV